MISQVVFSLHEFQDRYIFGKVGPSQMLWQNKFDLEKFKELTINKNGRSILIMGKNTFCSLPKKLPNRLHFVFSNSQKENIKNKLNETPDFVINSLEHFNNIQTELQETDLISIIGGYDLIKLLIENQHFHTCSNDCNENNFEILNLYITILSGDFNSTGKLISIHEFEFHDLLKDYNLISSEQLDEKVILYHYVRKDI